MKRKPQRKDKERRIAETAEAIANDLFSNAFGQKAEYLILKAYGEDLGGWCRGSAINLILRHLRGAK